MTPAVPLAAAGVLALLALASGSKGLRSTGASGPYATIPARALSQVQALTVLKSLDDAGIISVTRWPSDADLTMDMTGRVGDVQFLYMNSPRRIDHVDPRFAVFLTRLAAMLRSRFAVTAIHHLGIFPGKAATPDDVHNHGRAVDLLSFDGPPSGAEGDRVKKGNLSIKDDWGAKPTPYADNATITRYRLKPSDGGYRLFSALYQFIAEQAADRSQTPVQGGPPTRIGDHSFILSPDHPDPDYRPSHSGLNSHVHAQIGPTRGKDPLGT